LRLGEEFRVARSAADWSYQNDAMSLSIEHLAYGSFAPDNCALALTAACLVLEQQRLPVEPTVLAQALATTRLAGRMERHDYRDAPVVLDVAHNPAAAEFLAAELGTRWPERRYVAIYGALEDKDAVAVLAALQHLVLHWLLVPTFGWRGQTAEQLAARLEPGTDAEICASMAAALDRAHSLTAPGNGILAFGSFSAVEQARELLIDPGKQTDDG
jgi:dihydrofolate synthase/folylpolyglutamate synthase